jgi:hypothetical protein
MITINHRLRVGFAALVATSLLGGAALTAQADDAGTIALPADVPAAPKDSLPNRADKCLTGIDRRIADIGVWTSQIDGLVKVTADTKAVLRTELTSVATNLDTVARPAVVAATTPQQIKAACQSIVNDYRVYVVLHPRTFGTAAVDATLVSAEALRTKLTEVTGGAGNADVQALLDRAVANANAAMTTLAPLTASGYNAAPAPTKAAIKSARAQLKAAKKDLTSARTKLKKLTKPAAPTPTTIAPVGCNFCGEG